MWCKNSFMDSSSTPSSERRHSVPDTYYGKYRGRSPGYYEEKITKDQSIQTDNKLPSISDGQSCHSGVKYRRSCGHSHSRRKRFKRINHGELINMILKNGQLKMREKYSNKSSPSKKHNGKSKKDKCEKSNASFNDIKKLERQISRLFSSNSKGNSSKYFSENGNSNFLPNIDANDYSRVSYSSDSIKQDDEDLHEALLKLEDGEGTKNRQTQIFDMYEQQDNGDENTEEFLICFNDNEQLRSCVLQSLNDKYSRALSSTRSSSDYWSSYNTTATDRTVSTISLQSSSTYLEDLRKRNSNSEKEERANLPKSPRLFPLVVDAESLLSEPVQSGYIPSAQMKLISVHFLDSDSDNNIPSKSFAFRDHPYALKPTYEAKENVVIFELDNNKDENVNSTSQQSYSNNSLVSDLKQVPEKKRHSINKFPLNQPSSSVIHQNKSIVEKNTKSKRKNDLNYNSCSCTSAVSNILPQPYRGTTYGTPVQSRLSSMQKPYSTLVNDSNRHVNYASDSTDDEVSNPDSLDEISSKQKELYYNKHDEKIVRGDSSSLVLDRRPRKKHFSYTPYFITLNGDEIYSLHHLKYKLPEEIKKKLMNREKKLRKHSREKCKHCSKASLLKKIYRKKQQLKLKHQLKQSAEDKRKERDEKKQSSKKFCGHIDSNIEIEKKHQEPFEKHSCSNSIVVHEMSKNGSRDKTKYDSECCTNQKVTEERVQEKSLPTVRKQSTQTRSMLNDRKTILIRNHCTQTSLEEGNRELIETVEQTTNTEQTHLVGDRRSSNKIEVHRKEESRLRNEKRASKKSISNKNDTIKNQEKDLKESKDCFRQSKWTIDSVAIESATPDVDTSHHFDLKTPPDKSKRENDDVDKAIMYILLDGLMQNEKENNEKEIKKSIAVQVKSPETYKCSVQPEADMHRRLSNCKYERKFDIIPEEESIQNNSDFCGSPLDYNDKTQAMKPMYKDNIEPMKPIYNDNPLNTIKPVKQCRCRDEIKDTKEETHQDKMNREVAKYEDYLLNKNKSKFCCIEESHPQLREIPKEIPQPRKYSSVSNISIESLDLINPSVRRHKSNGSIPPVLNYKSAMMIGTFTPFSQQEEGSKGKKALTVGEQEELLSKGWINFYLLKGGDSHEFFSDAEDDYLFMPNFDMSEGVPKEKDTPVKSYDVEVKSKPEPVLPIIPNKTNHKPSQDKQVAKPKRGPLPKLNMKTKREVSKTPVKKEGAHKNCFLENSEFNNPKTKRFSQGAPESRRVRSPKNKSRQSLKPQKAEVTESAEPLEAAKAIEPAVKELSEINQQMGTPDTPCDSFVSQAMVDDFESHKEIDHTKELDYIVKDYDCSIRTVSSLSPRSDSDESQKQIVQTFSKPERDRPFQSQQLPPHPPSASSKPSSEHNWKVTVASEKSNAKQSSPNIELHLSMNSIDQSRERRKSKQRQTNKVNLSLTLKNFCGDSDVNSSSRQESFYDKEKNFPDHLNDPYAKKRYKNLTHADDIGSIRSSTAMSFHEDLQDREDITSSKRNTIAAEEGILSVTGSYITPEMRRKPPTMSEKDLSLYKNSKK